MNSLLAIIAFLLCAFIVLAVPELVNTTGLYGDYVQLTAFDYGKSVLLLAALSVAAGYIAYRQGTNGEFLLKLFVSALLLRITVGTIIYISGAQEFFGGDALTYDYWGWVQLRALAGDRVFQYKLSQYTGFNPGTGWGMLYMVSAIYALLGRNMFAVQLVNSVIGATTVIVIFLCGHHMFANARVARFAAIAVAFYPSLVLWSSQGLKDGPIVFLLALSILATLKLGQKFSIKYLAILIGSLFTLLSFRFYIFYMLGVAVAGAFIIGMQTHTGRSLFRQFVIMVILGLSFTYLGITRFAGAEFERFGSLERVQTSRLDAAQSAQSGFAKDLDVSTPEGALLTIPIGLVYLLFAPFPWQLASLRQSITLPEMLVWWACFPLLVLGVWFSVKYRLRQILPVLIFTVMLSLAYSIFQGNVGTAYRQRAQLLVFYFIFVAVGYVLLLEKREERRRQYATKQEALAIKRSALPGQTP
jgi:hypothetical protein